MNGGKSFTAINDDNIFYTGFAEAAKDPGPRTGYGGDARLDADLDIWVPSPAGNVQLLFEEPIRAQKQLIALSMVMGRRLDTVIQNNNTIIEDNQVSSRANLASLSALSRALSMMSQRGRKRADC
jgi:hypothetical protein